MTTLKTALYSLLLLCTLALFSTPKTLAATDPHPAPKFNILAFYNGTYDLAHINFVHEANVWFPKMGNKYGFTYTATNNWNNLNKSFLANFQVILFLDDSPHDPDQRAAFQQYMENGGGWMGFHVCAFSTNAKEWPWYFYKFLGSGMFNNNTWFPTTALLKVEDKNHPAMKGVPEKFTSAVSEWYSWTNDLTQNPDIDILASVDPSSFPLGTDPNQSWYKGYYPILWSNKKFKMIYANFGHNAMDYKANLGKSSTFASDDQNKFIINSLLWLVLHFLPRESRRTESITMTNAALQEVRDILIMYGHLQKSQKRHENASQIDTKFRGFSGNEEMDYALHTRDLIFSFPDLESFNAELNSHVPMLRMYRLMLRVAPLKG